MLTRLYLILVNGVLADKRMTQGGAMMVKRKLELKGYKNVSIAYDIAKENISGTPN